MSADNNSIQYPKEPPKEIAKKELFEKRPKDPGLWNIHDPAIYHDETSGNYYIYRTRGAAHRSKDMIHWERMGKIVTPPKEATDWTGSDDVWAPDIVKVGNEYRLYCSNSSWGVRQSCIFLAVADSAEGPFEPRGIVLKTTEDKENSSETNAIDANIITDVATGEMYMIYGSFWGGVRAIKLDTETGLAAEEGLGTCLARRPVWTSGAIEGPYMVYNPDTEYYYLFVSYGSLKSDYNIRVGRSKSILGPFVDFNGRELTDMTDEDNSVGQMVFCGYNWNDGTAYMGPGHNSVLHDTDDRWYLVCHIREKNFTGTPEPSTMQIRRIYWTREGWPVVSPEPYSGEVEQEISKEVLEGRYERINLISALPQGIQTAVPMKIEHENDYYECCSIQGTWHYENNTITISYGPNEDIAHVTAVWDHEKNQPTIAMCGMSKKGIPFWAKKVE